MNRNRPAFTLVELVVVIMILGILAGVAAPKFLNTSATAKDNGLRQTLAVIRDAIELHAATVGTNPPQTSDALFKAAIQPYLRGELPKCPVGGQQNNTVTFGTAADNASGWMYSATTGAFICNSTAADSTGLVTYNNY